MYYRYILSISGLIPPFLYTHMLEHISSHGFIILAPYVLASLPTIEYKAKWMIKLEEWAQNNLLEKLIDDGKK